MKQLFSAVKMRIRAPFWHGMLSALLPKQRQQQRDAITWLYPALLLLLTAPALAQNQPTTLSLEQVITQALSQSAVARQAITTRDQGYWQWRGYQANYRPQLGLQGMLPGYSRAVTPVVQPDGTTDFRAVRINNSNLAVTLTQNIGLTGGQVFVASEVQRFDDFNGRLRRYNNQPVAVGLTQPLGRFNALRWARRLEPLRYEESRRLFAEERETIAQRVTEHYFDVLEQQVNAEIAGQNVQANQELLRIGQERYQLGRLSQSDLLRLELNLLNARQAVAQGRLDAQNAAVELQRYTGLRPEIPLTVPAPAPRLVVSATEALAQARQNRSTVVAFRRRLLQAEWEVALVRGTTGFQATLAANLGYVNQAGNLWATYAALQNQQQVALSFALPLVDWGRQKALLKTAELTRRQVQTDVAQEEAGFELSVQVQAAQLSTLGEQLALAARADSLARQRYTIAQATYKVGRISLTDLTIAFAEKDQARRAYVLALRAAWVAHYRLRALTLYDFERQQPLAAQ